MDKSGCSICDNTFDGTNHRPRALPCGHGFCTDCIEACIHQGNKSCPVCKVEHGAKSATELPISFLLEEFLHKAAISDTAKEEVSGDMCPKHVGVPLYFLCQNHNIKVCHSCAVIDHPPASCTLIYLDEPLKRKKQTQIAIVQKQKQDFMDAEKDFKVILQKKTDYLTEQNIKKQGIEKELALLQTKIEQIKEDILKEETSRDEIKEAIQGCQMKQKSFEILENKLTAATINEDIVTECDMATNEILQSQKWEETARNKLNISKDKYARVERDGIHRSCKVFIEGEKMFIPSLSKAVNPPSSATLIKEAELGLTSGSTIVYLDISGRGHSLGRVFIRVLSDRPHGEQFVMLALGTHGSTLKGALFGSNLNNSMSQPFYFTEDGLRSAKPLLTTLKKDYRNALSRGRIFPWAMWGVNTASFRIITKSMDDISEYGHFADVVDGMSVLDTASSDYSFSIFNPEVKISNCGIVLDY